MVGSMIDSVRLIGRGLVDGFGRVATDLRVSLTDKCNLRCTYCMPAEGLDWLAKPELLTDDEIVRLVRVAVEQLGVDEVRFTGGEPLVRRGIVDIVARTTALDPSPRTSLTTNGLGLAKIAPALAAAGLHRVNVSLDTVDRATFAELTRRDRLPDVIDGLAAAAAAGPRRRSRSTRCSCAGVNDHQAPRPPGVVPRARLRAAVHRADAARRPARLDPRRA